jgi:SAM-dependent methyltransferase
MQTTESDKLFAGSIPKVYEDYLVPLIFESYAIDLANRVTAHAPARVLELAAGTGVLTRRLAVALPRESTIVATDLNQAMLDQASAVRLDREIEWRQADALHLPFADGSFDAVVCQFGVMFFPDKARAYAEACRVLARGGTCHFSVWCGMADNEFPDIIETALASVFPDDPPRFLSRIPYAYFDPPTIARDLKAGGFKRIPEFTTITARSHAASANVAAIAFCQGTPLRSEIEARNPALLGRATDIAAEAIAQRLGRGIVDGKIEAMVVSVGP